MLPGVKRKENRQDVKVAAIIIDAANKILGQCTIVNISDSGAKLAPLMATETPCRFDLVLTRGGTVRRHCEIVWRSETEIGVIFLLD